jgi:nucleoside-diphosphate-sugar epimerase
MTTAVVTGAAGFIGSHLCELLLAAGDHVRGVDCFTAFYDRQLKERNLAGPRSQPGFTFVEGDLAEMPLLPLFDGVDVFYHLAGQPGVRPSWGAEFVTYVRQNIEVTQRLLELSRTLALRKFVYASSSSVYGEAETYPTRESIRPKPVSPYGVTKLAAEHLCEVYRSNFGVPTASLRLFTVYGPHQRPDMAFTRLVEAALTRKRFELYGDGEQTRDFTFVGDVVQAMRDAAISGWTGVANIGGGARTSMNEVIATIESLCGPVEVTRRPPRPGDVRHTGADTRTAAAAFAYAPRTSLSTGLEDMVRSKQLSTRVAAG